MSHFEPVRIQLPAALRLRAEADGTLPELAGVGNAELLAEPLLGLLCSRECPGSALIDTLERIPQWVQEGRVILSGFHSPLEQQVLRSTLRRGGRIVKLLARGIVEYHPPPQERESLATGAMLVLTAQPSAVCRITRETALARNRLVRQLAAEVLIPHVAESSGLAALLAQVRLRPFAAGSTGGDCRVRGPIFAVGNNQ